MQRIRQQFRQILSAEMPQKLPMNIREIVNNFWRVSVKIWTHTESTYSEQVKGFFSQVTAWEQYRGSAAKLTLRVRVEQNSFTV